MVVTDPVTCALSENDSSLDANKVARLKTAITRGEYRIDHDALANAIIGFGRFAECRIFDVAVASKN